MPQFAGSLARRTHWLLHRCVPPEQLHRPFAHVPFAPHALLQAPQCELSLVVLMHCPLHETKPVGHALWHMPLLHVWFAAHVMPQPPQFLTLVSVSMHAPSHSVRPIEHALAQVPCEHT